MEKLPPDLETAFIEWDEAEEDLRRLSIAYQEAAANRDRREVFLLAFKLGGALTEQHQAMRKAMDLTIDWVSKGVTNADN